MANRQVAVPLQAAAGRRQRRLQHLPIGPERPLSQGQLRLSWRVQSTSSANEGRP
jgi:hypothetical protein